MRNGIHIGLLALFALGIAAGALFVVSNRGAARPGNVVSSNATTPAQPTAANPADRINSPFSEGHFIEDSGFQLAGMYTTPVSDRSNLEQIRGAIRNRATRGIAALREAIDRSPPGDPQRAQHEMLIALLFMYDGKFTEARPWLDSIVSNESLSPVVRNNVLALRGVASLRRGELDNCVACVGPSSCLFPIAPEAVHLRPEGSREAIKDFTAYLRERPDDLGMRWLLNIAYQTVGEYPDKVPPEYLISLDPFRSKRDPGRFTNVAPLVGLDARGPNMLGGSLFDDFNGDGLPDIFVASNDCDLDPSLFLNKGDGRFEMLGPSAGLSGQGLPLNARQADFDNDGRLDILLLRGGWEDASRMSLLRNTGSGFEDVTVASGLAEPIATESASWGDYDNDGLLDLYVAGEIRKDKPYDSRNQCRLYHNEGRGKFVNVAAKAGVENGLWTKGTAWGDYDNDGLIDLYVSNMEGTNRLYHNNGNGTFTDVAERLRVTEPSGSFSCWFWDYDNDGRLDIFVAAFHATLNDYVKDILGKPSPAERPRLFRNLGPEGFRDVTKEAGLDRVYMTMGSNFADIDNDGWLDMYLGTGLTSYSSLVPNVMLKNVDGQRFEDVTVATGTGHLQKGHGVSFADWDGDGDLDLFVETGGSVPGDQGHNALFQNPGHNRHWLALKLIGTKSNRAAIGAKVQADIKTADGHSRSIYRVVNSGSSFGGNSLVVHLGLDSARKVDTLTITWPIGKSTQTFQNIDVDQILEITEGTQTHQARHPKRLTVPAVEK